MQLKFFTTVEHLWGSTNEKMNKRDASDLAASEHSESDVGEDDMLPMMSEALDRDQRMLEEDAMLEDDDDEAGEDLFASDMER